MAFKGGCYCGAVRFEAGGPSRLQALCGCRTCQTLTGWPDDLFLVVDKDSFRITRGEPAEFTRTDLSATPTRAFCGNCRSQLTARSPREPDVVLIQIGALDDPGQLEGPDVVLWTEDMHPFALPHAGQRGELKRGG